MLSKTFLPMMVTATAAMGVYYLLDVKTDLPDSLSMTGGIGVGILGAIAAVKLIKKD